MWENLVFPVVFDTCDVVYNYSICLLPPSSHYYSTHTVLQIFDFSHLLCCFTFILVIYASKIRLYIVKFIYKFIHFFIDTLLNFYVHPQGMRLQWWLYRIYSDFLVFTQSFGSLQLETCCFMVPCSWKHVALWFPT